MNQIVKIEKSVAAPASEIPFEQREMELRSWIARKESVCPYAPGLARFIYLPEGIDSLKIEHVHYFAKELKAFYDAKEKGKRIGRWMLMPYREWQSHEEAHSYSERVFWLLNAAYFHLVRDQKSVQASLNQELKGYDRGYKGEILNPVIGKLPKRQAKVVPAKSLFYSALSPLYRNKKFFRYSPHSVIPLVYATEFHMLKEKHPKVTESVTFEMAYSGLFETFGEVIELDLKAFRQELPIWGAIIDRTAQIMRSSANSVSSHAEEVKGCPQSNLGYFRLCNPQLVDSFYTKYMKNLPILTRIVQRTGAHPKLVISSSFAGSGLYTLPDYFPGR